MSLLLQELQSGPPELRIFTSDLEPFADSVLKAALTMNLRFQETDGNVSMPFWRALNARRSKENLPVISSMNTAEREFVTEYLNREINKVDNIVTIVDCLLQNPDACMKEAGVIFEKGMAPKKSIQTVLPDDDTGKIGGQLVAGALMAAFARDNKTVRQNDLGVLEGYVIPDFSVVALAKFQTALLPDMKRFFAGKESKGKGRPYISEIFSYLRNLSFLEYYPIHMKICETLLAGCFEFRYYVRHEGTYRKYKTPVKDSFPVIFQVKEQYKSCFLELNSDYEGIDEFITITKIKGPLFAWCRGLPTIAEVEHDPLENFSQAHKYLQSSRSFRGSDESGLSAWTSSYLACPGYTKEHLSICRLLSLVLGCARDGMVYVHGTSESFRAKVCRNLEIRKVTSVRFVVDKNSLSTSEHASLYVLMEANDKKKAKTSIYVVDQAADSAKEEDWKSVDGNAQTRIANYFPANCGRTAILTHVQSDVWFQKAHGFHIGSPTSIHSFYAVVANFPVSLAASDGFGAPLIYLPMTDRTRSSFLSCILAQNMARNLSFLFPSYHCNPRMNLLVRPEAIKIAFKKVKISIEGGQDVDYDSTHCEPDDDDDYEEEECSVEEASFEEEVVHDASPVTDNDAVLKAEKLERVKQAKERHLITVASKSLAHFSTSTTTTTVATSTAPSATAVVLVASGAKKKIPTDIDML